jgi:hypothetical protein
MNPVGAVVVSGSSTAVGAGAEVALVAEDPELNDGHTSRVWGWQKGLNNCGDKVDKIPAESMGRRRHGTLRSAPLQHGDPGG